MIAETAAVRLPPWARLRFDRVRDRWVLLAPERVLFPCPISVEILQRLGDDRPLGALIDGLAADYEAPRATLARDVEGVLAGLAEQGFLEIGEPVDG
jgi:pyrroloquinoline quinone biosynthesis protein D